MFVRKGTISRKNRGSGRRSVRRPATRESSNPSNGGPIRKPVVLDDPVSTGSGSVRFDTNPSRSNSFRSERPHSRSGSFRSIDSAPCQSTSGYNRKFSAEERYQVFDETNHLQIPVARPSPAKSVATTIASYDEEKRLVRTSVNGWERRHVEEHASDYGALWYQIDEASKEAEHVFDFLSKISTILCNTLFVTFLVGISMAIPIAMVSVGVKYLDDCPKQPCIPVYLLVGGCFGMLKVLSTLWRNIQHRRQQDVELVFDDHDSDGMSASATYKTLDVMLAMFLLGWQITGTYWVYEIWKPLFTQLLHEPSNWCDETVYMFAIYQIVACYIILGIVVLVYCVMCVCYKCLPLRRW